MADKPIGYPIQLFIVLHALIPNEEVKGYINVNLFVISLYVATIFEKLAVPVRNCAFNATKNVVTVSLPGVIVYVNVFPV